MPTLYLNGHETEAKLDGNRVELSRINREKNDIDVMHVHLFDIERVVMAGKAGLTVPLLHRLVREGIPIQRLAANREASATPEQTDVTNSLQALIQKADEAPELDTLRGVEGYAAALYFKRLATFFPAAFPFTGRSRRPPRDAANALLSFAYTIVLSEVDAALRAAGFDPCLGFLHEISYGRPSLALDLLEPLRAPLCDLLVLRIFNHELLKPADFELNPEDGGTYLTRDGRKTFFIEYERSMTRRFSETKNAPHTDFRKVIRDQTENLMRAMDGKTAGPFFQMP